MYTPPAFAATDLGQLDALLQAHPFVTLVTVGADGAPFASHLPVLHRREGARVLVEGHWARPNPQARHDGPALMIVHGPQAYVSPAWYPDKEAAASVPTWNYAVAHLSGTLQPFEDEPALASLVDRMSRRFDAEAGQSWRYEHDRQDHRRQLRGIIGFRFEPAQVAMKFKLNQNHPPANRAAVADQLERSGRPGDAAVAALMRAR